jgi:5-(carboxyamino)imidazole ribonucleotide mutase
LQADFYFMQSNKTLVGIVMGSDSDLPIMQAAAEILTTFNIGFELTIVSAHRTPQRLMEYAGSAKQRGLKTIIAGAGGAAHLPGMIASVTTLPVIGVPIKSSNSIDGWDSVLSILQMPNGVPVATVALNAAKNAGILAAQVIGAFDDAIAEKLAAYKAQMNNEVLEKAEKMKSNWNNEFDV